MNSAPSPTSPSSAIVASSANIAFIKYWGARDLDQVVPVNRSISMTLTECRSICQATFDPTADGDQVWLVETVAGERRRVDPGVGFRARVIAHLDRLRAWAGVQGGFEIDTCNSFPAASGMASSASGFSALTCAVVSALDRVPPDSELSILCKLSGSGSAARSVFGGYVEWPTDEDGRAAQLHDQEHWDLRDVIAVVETGAKEVSSRDGHARATSSPYFEHRLLQLDQRLEAVREGLRSKDFALLGPVIEEDAIDLHLIAMSSRPAIFYWKPATLAVLEAVRELRADGVPAFATMDAGANVHVICQPESESAISDRLATVDGVLRIIRDRVGVGPRRLASFEDPAGVAIGTDSGVAP
jgi:diphosphomevalonate decarboxylase